jgi:endogenous inhibitor of DNA gyrase (YacG/DUF329 family)
MSTRTCPICDKSLSEETYRPFCSRRCADVDLHRWVSGRYAIPAVEGEEGVQDSDESDADKGV